MSLNATFENKLAEVRFLLIQEQRYLGSRNITGNTTKPGDFPSDVSIFDLRNRFRVLGTKMYPETSGNDCKQHSSSQKKNGKEFLDRKLLNGIVCLARLVLQVAVPWLYQSRITCPSRSFRDTPGILDRNTPLC